MKKSQFRSIVYSFLLVFSFASYVYLKNIPVEDYRAVAIEETMEEKGDQKETSIFIADIALAKKIIYYTKVIFDRH